jgi:carbon starvation protein
MAPMSLFLLAAVPLLIFAAAYYFYGGWLKRTFGLNDARPTPAAQINDGRDFVPTRRTILLAQHFAAVAAVGPIAGPIIAGERYGWLASAVWIVLGTVFIGAVHDFAALVASVRHGAKSLGEVFRQTLGGRASLAFTLFIWLSLIYVIVVFMDLTSAAFVSRPELGAANFGPGVATSSLFYLLAGCGMGLALKKFKAPLWLATAIFVPLVFFAVWGGQKIPMTFGGDALAQQKIWNVLILIYCAAASLIPMWVLLQPRGYLGGFILYATFAAGLVGLFFGGYAVQRPALADALSIFKGGVPIFPLMFTTIACGAVSGFHGLVSSGTSSKQLRRESDAVAVGYGGMLLEGLVAVISLATVMIVVPAAGGAALGPDDVYGRGMAHFLEVLGIPFAAGVVFGKLAFATFIYDTLDVATRLGRYVFEEVFSLKGRVGAIAGTAATLAVPLVTVFTSFHDAAGNPLPLWKIFWPAFGTSNQLLAALTLTGITVWLKKEGKKYWVTGLPAAFMSLVTLWSLLKMIEPWFAALAAGRWGLHPVGTTGFVMLLLSLAFYTQSLRVFATRKNS